MPFINDPNLDILIPYVDAIEARMPETLFILKKVCRIGGPQGCFGYHFQTVDNMRHAWLYNNRYIDKTIFSVGSVRESDHSDPANVVPNAVNPPFTVKLDTKVSKVEWYAEQIFEFLATGKLEGSVWHLTFKGGTSTFTLE